MTVISLVLGCVISKAVGVPSTASAQNLPPSDSISRRITLSKYRVSKVHYLSFHVETGGAILPYDLYRNKNLKDSIDNHLPELLKYLGTPRKSDEMYCEMLSRLRIDFTNGIVYLVDKEGHATLARIVKGKLFYTGAKYEFSAPVFGRLDSFLTRADMNNLDKGATR